MIFSQQCSAVTLILALLSGHVAVCGGWAATPEARMACCGEGACPMHESDSPNPGSKTLVTQSEADSCCAASEQGDSTPSASASVFSVSLGVVPSPVASLVLSQPHPWRLLVPLPGTNVPSHFLRSVLLV